jgi:hypothetical protein
LGRAFVPRSTEQATEAREHRVCYINFLFGESRVEEITESLKAYEKMLSEDNKKDDTPLEGVELEVLDRVKDFYLEQGHDLTKGKIVINLALGDPKDFSTGIFDAIIKPASIRSKFWADSDSDSDEQQNEYGVVLSRAALLRRARVEKILTLPPGFEQTFPRFTQNIRVAATKCGFKVDAQIGRPTHANRKLWSLNTTEVEDEIARLLSSPSENEKLEGRRALSLNDYFESLVKVFNLEDANTMTCGHAHSLRLFCEISKELEGIARSDTKLGLAREKARELLKKEITHVVQDSELATSIVNITDLLMVETFRKYATKLKIDDLPLYNAIIALSTATMSQLVTSPCQK